MILQLVTEVRMPRVIDSGPMLVVASQNRYSVVVHGPRKVYVTRNNGPRVAAVQWNSPVRLKARLPSPDRRPLFVRTTAASMHCHESYGPAAGRAATIYAAAGPPRRQKR